MELDDKQQRAVELCLDLAKRVVAISGPAGSGKTTIIRTIYDQLRARGFRVALCAPTGKAARRITEATGIPAVTIHKLLEYPRPGERDEKTGKPLDTGHPKRGRTNPLDQQIVICDEYMMVNHELNRNIIDALPTGGCLRAFGDVAQLPPIEPHKLKAKLKAPFEEHIDRNSVVLDKIYRQEEGSGILTGANNIRKGIMFKRTDDLTVHITDRPVDDLYEYVLEMLDHDISFGKLENQIITTTRKKRWIATDKLNPNLRDIFNPDVMSQVPLPRFKWDQDGGDYLMVGVGDKIVCTENTYDMRDFQDRYAEWDKNKDLPVFSSFIPTPDNKTMLNGETGIVLAVHEDGSLEVDFGDRVVEIPASYWEYWPKKNDFIQVDPRRQIDLAYALTTHKMQGSECERVIYLMNKSCSFMQGRENFYTAVTRARHHAHIITDQKSLSEALRYKVRR